MQQIIKYMSSKYVIKKGNITYTPSIYQEEILKFAHEGVGDAFINACAGSSKTTMLENIVYQVPNEKKKICIAFNKSIVDEMKNRIGESVDNLHITTYHSLGYSILNENFPNIDFEVDEDKYTNYLRTNLLSLTSYGETTTLGRNYYSYLRNIIQLIDYARYYHRSNIIGIKNIAERYVMNLYRDECVVCKKVLDWGRSNYTTIDYTDMVWLVNELNLTTKKHLYDFVLIDEAQDTSVMQQQMTERCLKRGCRKFIVGDKHQSINTWCGSDFDAVEKFKSEKTKEFELPISYRCPRKIVELAKKYSPNIQCSENAEEGEIRYNVSINMPCGNDMVLCRHTAPLIDLQQKYFQINKKCYIKGAENIFSHLRELILNTNSQYIDINCNTMDGLFPKLYNMLNDLITKLIENDYPLEDVYTHISVLELYDNINSIKVLCANLRTCEELLKKINDVFNDRTTEGVMLSTIHKAKGLESDNVYILYPSLLPNKYARKEWEKISEEHITYVAYTRARKTLNFMDEGYVNPMGNISFNYKKMINEINAINKKITINAKNNITENTLSVSNFKNNSLHVLGQKNINNNKTGNKFKDIF